MPPPKFKPPAPKSDVSALDIIIIGILMAAIIFPLISGFVNFGDPLSSVARAKVYFTPFFRENLWWIKIVAAVVSGLCLWGMVHIIKKTEYLEIKREQFLDILGRGYVARRRALKIWLNIQKRLESPELNNWKIAILEADHILNEILKMAGYLGNRLEDKLSTMDSSQLTNIEDIKRAHAVRDKIASDPTLAITQDEAKEIVNVYKIAFKDLKLISED